MTVGHNLSPESEWLPLSALQHLLFCERQCALIHIEGIWSENFLTAAGRNLHEAAHEGGTESRSDLRIARGLRLRSERLGLSGQADVVEFHRASEYEEGAVALEGVDGRWRLYPVEYKRGRPKPDECDMVQLTAQAMALEEMTGAVIMEGAIYYGKPRRRQAVSFDAGLRERTDAAAKRLHALVAAGVTPPAKYEKKCDACSLFEDCRPKSAGAGRAVAPYLKRIAEI